MNYLSDDDESFDVKHLKIKHLLYEDNGINTTQSQRGNISDREDTLDIERFSVKSEALRPTYSSDILTC